MCLDDPSPHDILKSPADAEGCRRAAQEIYRLQAENLWTIGTVAGTPTPLIYSRNLGNISAAEADYFAVSVLSAAEQWSFASRQRQEIDAPDRQ